MLRSKKLIHCWVFSLLIAGTVLITGCGSKSNPTSNNPTPKPIPTPSYSTSAVTVVSETSSFPTFIAWMNGSIWATDFETGTGPWVLDEYTSGSVPVTSISTFNGGATFNNFQGVNAGPDGTVYVADAGNKQVEVFSSTGIYQTAIAGLTLVSSTAVNSSGTTLYVLMETPAIWTYSINNSTIPKTFTAPVSFTTTASGVGKLDGPVAMSLDASGNVYVTNYTGGNIVKYGPTGVGPVSFGSALVTRPEGIVVDSVGNVLVAQWSNPGFIQEFTPSGSSYAAGATFGNSVLTGCKGLALDSSGNLYVANGGTSQILEFKNTN